MHPSYDAHGYKANSIKSSGCLGCALSPPSLMSSHWKKSRVRRYFGCCTADLQPDENQHQLNNNPKIVKLETSSQLC